VEKNQKPKSKIHQKPLGSEPQNEKAVGEGGRQTKKESSRQSTTTTTIITITGVAAGSRGSRRGHKWLGS
jgi:hypothetical protein